MTTVCLALIIGLEIGAGGIELPSERDAPLETKEFFLHGVS